MQHPTEVSQSKNTVHLLSLALPQTQIFVGESAADFTALRAKIAASLGPVWLIYPSEHSKSIEQVRIDLAPQPTESLGHDLVNEAKVKTTEKAQQESIILLDGTWRKAYRMLKLNPWLLELPSLHLNFTGKSQYIIRKSSRSDSLSTLEATAYSLQALEPELDIGPILTLFDAMVQHRLMAMPAAVRQGYL